MSFFPIFRRPDMLRTRFLFLSLPTIFLLLSSCSKNKIDSPAASAGKDLIDIVIPAAENTGYTTNGFSFIRNGKAYVTLPPEADPSNVHLTFEVSPDASLSLDDTPVFDLTGNFDLSRTVKATVTSAAGDSKVYEILAQPGIAEIDQLFYAFKENFDIPGLSIAILKTEESGLLYKSGIGYSDQDKKIRTKPEHLFRLGSISKQFTSICIMKLIQEGAFSVESTVFGPEGILADRYTGVSPMAAKVTVRHLLDHTSGWESDPDPMFTGSFSGQSLDERIENVLASPQIEPGTVYSYFNMGYGILGKVIEEVSGMAFEAYLQEVMALAGLQDVHVGGDFSQKRPNETIYYSQDGYNGYNNEMEVIAAAGGIIASAEEMMKLITRIDGREDVPDILESDIRELMLTPSHSDTYALGWRLNHRLFPGSWFHGGNLAGTATFWVMGPTYSTVILCNSRSYIDGFDDELYYLSEKMIRIAEKL